MSLDTSLQSKLALLAGVPVQQNYSSMDLPETRVWYQRQSGQAPTDLAGRELLLRETVYGIEVNSTDPDRGADIAEAISALAPTGMNGFRGTMGDQLILACFVEDASDDYVPRGNLNSDAGFHVFAFNLRILN